MTYTKTFLLPGLLAVALTACSNGDEAGAPVQVAVDTGAPEVTFEPKGLAREPHTPFAPVRLEYKILGKPTVGQPVAIDLKIQSNMGPQAVNVNYRITDSSALVLGEAQLPNVEVLPDPGESFSSQQVIVVPQREGRLYLNVACDVKTPDGLMSTVQAIPIQVGAGTRQLEENGVVTTDENGELIRSLPATTE